MKSKCFTKILKIMKMLQITSRFMNPVIFQEESKRFKTNLSSCGKTIPSTYPPPKRYIESTANQILFQYLKILQLLIPSKMFINYCPKGSLKQTAKVKVPSEVYSRKTKSKTKYHKLHLNSKLFDLAIIYICLFLRYQ